MFEHVASQHTETPKIVALKFRTRKAVKDTESAGEKGTRFAEIDKVLDDIFRNDRLRCA